MRYDNTTKINKIIKEGSRVYLSTKTGDDKAYKLEYAYNLTKYLPNKTEFDAYVISMILYEDYKFCGNHYSIMKYKDATYSDKTKEICAKHKKILDERVEPYTNWRGEIEADYFRCAIEIYKEVTHEACLEIAETCLSKKK